MNALYIHIPFCHSKCHYCDFFSVAQTPESTTAEQYWKAVAREAASAAPLLAPSLVTVYIGGGTPSVVQVSTLRDALKPISIPQRKAPQYEWTIEVNPASVTRSTLAAYREWGINRLSIGVQALDNRILRWLGRRHDGRQALDTIEAAFACGFQNISVDLMCGIPGQTQSMLQETLGTLTAYPISHLSCYILTLHPEHPQFDTLPNESQQLAQYLLVNESLRSKGFLHYEISNYAKPGFESAHNLNYWKGGSYLGLGPSAHSFDAKGGRRWKNYSGIAEYEAALSKGQNSVEWEEILTEEQKQLEQWMLGLRLAEGVPAEWFRTNEQRQTLDGLIQRGLAEQQASRVRLTPHGFALCDTIVSRLAIIK